MNQDRWTELMQSIDCPASLDTFQALVDAYSEKRRFYHTRNHISDCLQQFDRASDLAKHLAEVELAPWFHDAIYNPVRSNN